MKNEYHGRKIKSSISEAYTCRGESKLPVITLTFCIGALLYTAAPSAQRHHGERQPQSEVLSADQGENAAPS